MAKRTWAFDDQSLVQQRLARSPWSGTALLPLGLPAYCASKKNEAWHCSRRSRAQPTARPQLHAQRQYWQCVAPPVLQHAIAELRHIPATAPGHLRDRGHWLRIMAVARHRLPPREPGEA